MRPLWLTRPLSKRPRDSQQPEKQRDGNPKQSGVKGGRPTDVHHHCDNGTANAKSPDH